MTSPIRQRKSALSHRLAVSALTALATFAGLPVSAATTSFPTYPLLTGGNSIPPNILLILDDSGSMAYPKMPEDRSTLRDRVTDRSYVHNTLYYNPAKTYLPWRTASTDLNARLTNANFRAAAYSDTSPTGSALDLRGDSESYFYVPNTSNPGSVRENFDKYRIGYSTGSTSYDGGAVQKLTPTQLKWGEYPGIKDGNNSDCVSVDVSGYTEVTVTVRGNYRADLYAYANDDCTRYSGRPSHTNSDDPKQVSFDAASMQGSWISFLISADGAIQNKTAAYEVTGYAWRDMTPSGNTVAKQRAELQNFANWYQYHRTRNKMAKAGASEAFGRLGKNYRVGFDTIWNRGGTKRNTSGSSPAFPIPYIKNNGLFEDSGSVDNRSVFYSRLHAAGADDSTPLKGALQRAARYFATDDPWKDSDGKLLTCRQNYALLTTDGYWNSDSGYTAVGNADNEASWAYRDNYSNTLADVAYKYWKEDLRTGMADNVPSGPADGYNNKQHMVTFGISIGLRGTLDPTLPPPSPWNVNPGTNSDNEGPERIDDLWHAAINGHGTFVVASDTDSFANALIGALAAIDARSASGSNIASSSTKTDTTTLTFVAGFTSSVWSGDLIASPFNAALTDVSNTPLWTLSKTFGPSGVNSNFKNRKVLTSKGGSAGEFDASVSGASDFAVRIGQADEATAAVNIAYLRGDQSKESDQPGGYLRKRVHPIGDIVDSSPKFVEDSNTVFIGANDGMLHALDASNGKVLFSYVPKGIDFAAMASLSSNAYQHRYFVDGQIDVIASADQGHGRNILVGALGRGGRGVYALDVTTPASMGTGDVLWDNTTQDSTTEKDMGYVLGQIRIRKGNGGKTYAFVPNGIDSPNGSATLFVYELDRKGDIAKTTKLVAAAGGGNGLMSLGMADLNGDGTVDTVYGGDLKGNVWRWDFSGNAAPTTQVKLFQALDASGKTQPITGGIGVGRDPDTGKIYLGFGTGSFIASEDVPGSATQTTQSLYGIEDNEGAPVTGRSQLQARTIPYRGTTSTGASARGFESYTPLPDSKKGWYIDLDVPERVISAPTIYGSAMFVSSVIPATGSDCEGVMGSGFLNALNLFSGTSPRGGRDGGYFTDTGIVRKGDEVGTLGSIGVAGGMPTEANISTLLATVGTGAFSSDGTGNTASASIRPPSGGQPSRVNWRELIPAQ
ncbi:hypothetical protein MASR1M8_10160 [Thermomonas brevis]